MASPYVPATEQLVVEVFVRSLARAIDFYRALGFQLVSRKDGFATVAGEEHELFLDERPHHVPPPTPLANVRVMVPDVDAWWQRAVGMGARVVTPIADRDYGLRDFTIADPDGFGVRFGTRIEAR
jgi:catechol 2,3-dioxygenase-like lactoylglutathione lyase family enzyme